jgi:hypothetical protein
LVPNVSKTQRTYSFYERTMGFWVVLSFLVENGYLLVLSFLENDGYEVKEPT